MKYAGNKRKVKMALQWSEELSVNVKNFDNHHKKLIDLINELHDAMLTGKTRNVLGKTLEALKDYTKYHFGEEEELMKAHSYQDYVLHKSEHDNFVIKVSESIEKYEAGRMTVSIELMNFLIDWLDDHIMGTDKKYSQFFNAKGIL